MFTKIIFLSFLSLFLFGCKHKDSASLETTWIGGEILNPKLDYLLISKGDLVLDTIKLNPDNTFLHQFSNLEEGLYILGHYENQIFYLQPGDSLMLHINTIDFDESLFYSGRGGNKNNLLMSFFLLTEEEKKSMPTFYNLPQPQFEKKLDSLKKNREALYNEFLKNNSVSEGFKKVALANIKYDNFSKKELYITANEVNNLNPLSNDFYSYRENIDFGNQALRFYYPYYRFLNRYFDNIAFSELEDKSMFARNSFAYHYKKLHIIDSLITNDSLKNSLLRNNSKQFLFTAKNANEETKLLNLFLKLNTNPAHQKELKELATTALKITPGNKIHNLILVSTRNSSVKLWDIIKRPSIIFFWSYENIKSYRNVHSRVAELKSKYPEYDFIGINTDLHFKKWRGIVKNEGFDEAMEFQFENNEDTKKLIISSTSKAIILDQSGMIREGNTNLFNPNFETLLLGYLNK